MLCKSIDELFVKGSDGVEESALKGLMQKVRCIVQNYFNPFCVFCLYKLSDPSLLRFLNRS